MTRLLDLTCSASATVSVVSILETASTVLTIIASIVAIVTGIVSIILKLRKASSDGIITKEEKAEIFNDVEEVKEKIEELKKK